MEIAVRLAKIGLLEINGITIFKLFYPMAKKSSKFLSDGLFSYMIMGYFTLLPPNCFWVFITIKRLLRWPRYYSGTNFPAIAHHRNRRLFWSFLVLLITPGYLSVWFFRPQPSLLVSLLKPNHP